MQSFHLLFELDIRWPSGVIWITDKIWFKAYYCLHTPDLCLHRKSNNLQKQSPRDVL